MIGAVGKMAAVDPMNQENLRISLFISSSRRQVIVQPTAAAQARLANLASASRGAAAGAWRPKDGQDDLRGTEP